MQEKTFHKDINRLMERRLTASQIADVKAEAQEEILQIRLSDLRRQMNITQSKVRGFSQPAIASLEKRKDLKLSTLIHYLQAIGMGIEINVFPRKKRATIPARMVLLDA